MNKRHPDRSNRWPALALGIAALTGAAAARAETVYVTDTANVLSDEGPASTLVATAPQGAAMQVLQRDGDWMNIQVTLQGGQVVTGWILSQTVQSSPPGGSFFGGLSGGNDASASNVTASAASKGLNPEAADWANQNNLNPKLELQMEADRKAISNADWEAFRTLPDGTKLGKGK